MPRTCILFIPFLVAGNWLPGESLAGALEFTCGENTPSVYEALDLQPLQFLYDDSICCIRGRFEVPGWISVATIYNQADATYRLAYMVFDQQGKRVSINYGPPGPHEIFFSAVEAADFDGDGAMEVVGKTIAHYDDAVISQVNVLAVRGSGVVPIFARTIRTWVHTTRFTGAVLPEKRVPREDQVILCEADFDVRGEPGKKEIVIADGVVTKGKLVPSAAALDEAHCPREQEVYRFEKDRIRIIGDPGKTEDWWHPMLDPNCPPARVLAGYLGVRPGTGFGDRVRCLRGRFPGPGLLVAAEVYIHVGNSHFELSVIDSRGLRTAQARLKQYSDPTGVSEFLILEGIGDLDRDGRDEVILRNRLLTPGHSQDHLQVFRLKGRTFTKVFEGPFNHLENVNWVPRGEHSIAPQEPEDSVECKADYGIESGPDGHPELWITRELKVGKRVKEGKSRRIRKTCPPGLERLRMNRRGEIRVVHRDADPDCRECKERTGEFAKCLQDRRALVDEINRAVKTTKPKFQSLHRESKKLQRKYGKLRCEAVVSDSPKSLVDQCKKVWPQYRRLYGRADKATDTLSRLERRYYREWKCVTRTEVLLKEVESLHDACGRTCNEAAMQGSLKAMQSLLEADQAARKKLQSLWHKLRSL